ncbi:DUF503 domain-containing protein [bacterium]|nr:DUF503 domain-containing protein [bacterium]
MVVGTLRVVLYIHGADSLKDKRSVVRRVLARTRNEFNVAAAEVEDNDVIGTAVVAFVTVGNDRRHVNSVLDHVLDYVENLQLAEVGDCGVEILSA